MNDKRQIKDFKLLVTIHWLLVTLFLTAKVFSAEIFQEITVKEGDTLWSIANYYLKDPQRWPEILKHNNLPLTDPTIALPGMKLKVPVLLIKEQLRKATLVLLLNDVRYRKKDQATWKKAVQEMELYNEDGLRTMENSRAHVKFYSGDILKLDENSLVILRPELKVEEVSLISGAIRASKTKTITPTAQVSPQTRDTIYKARIRDDQATIVQVEKGQAEVLGLDTGKRVVVHAGFANITLPKQDPTLPVRAPQLSEFQLPEFTHVGNLIVSPEIKAAVQEVANQRLELQLPEEFSAQKEAAEQPEERPKGADKQTKNWMTLKIVVAKDPKFTQVVWQEKKRIGSEKPVTDAKDYNLPDGKYYRGVTFIDESGQESAVRSLGLFEIDTQPPKITLFSPQEGYQTRDSMVTVEGQTKPRSLVTINNYPVSISAEGKFSWSAVLAKEGANKIKIVVKDSFGNKSEFERTVYLASGR